MMEDMLNILRRKSLPKVYRIGPNLFCASFWLMKLCVAMQMIEEAMLSGRIGRDGLLIESTSGTMGYALAIAARAFGLQVQLVGDPAIDPHLQSLLGLLGADVEIVREKLPIGGYQLPRLRRLKSLMDSNPGAIWTKQYDNGANPRSYRGPARKIASVIGRVDCLVATTGSGGSISGTSRALRAIGHPSYTVAVDTHNSVLFGQPDGPRQLRGLGNSILPKNLDHSLIDEVHWVEAADAYFAARLLLTDYGLDMGPTTGAAFLVARQIAALHPNRNVVFLGPDRAERYIDTVFNPSFCRENGVWTDVLPRAPYTISHPRDAGGGWARIEWKQRNLKDFNIPEREGISR